ncbi:MAG: Mini-ribonuclease 3 [Anaerovoracaceae bacterium]|jgi:ribonuclease-3 family protein
MDKNNIATMNTTVLAYLGDSVYELFVRRHVLDSGQVNADKLHKSAVKYVQAEAQATALKKMLSSLDPKELGLVKRARNKKTTSRPKNVDPILYKWATAFEALIGYLYLIDNKTRLMEVVNEAIAIIEESKSVQHDRKKNKE